MNDNVCGYGIYGTVIETGPASRYTVWDTAFGSNYPGRSKPVYDGGYQEIMILESDLMFTRLPAKLPLADAAALGVMVRTAGDALMNLFGLPFPAIGVLAPPATGGLLIWGGASTVGIAAIQLAKAMGLNPIFTTASSANLEALLKLGATACFDYLEANVTVAIPRAAKDRGYAIKYVLDTVCKVGAPGTIEQCQTIAASFDVLFAATLPQYGNPRWKMTFVSRDIDAPVPFPIPGGEGKANMEWEPWLKKAVAWAAEIYGKHFRIPNIRIVKGGNMEFGQSRI